MIDREKVIKGLEYHLSEITIGKKCFQCPYFGDNPCEQILIASALELLKEQEPVKPMAGGLCGVGGWISVKDRLPKKFGEPCIVYNGCSVQYGDYYSDGIWYTPDCYESEEIRDVTHWMPMPEPPKEESND